MFQYWNILINKYNYKLIKVNEDKLFLFNQNMIK